MTERDLFLAALDVPADDRPAFLDRACGADESLGDRVRALLHAHDRAGGFLDDPTPGMTGTWGTASDAGPAGPEGERAGAVLGGRYRLLEPIGEGGMGAVWLAEQIHPVRRAVAVKLIKEGKDSARVLARFEVERQALALMDHPHIARVLDAGTAESGRPFFVMELVKGVPLTRYAGDRRLTVPQRLELIIQVCAAVQHAHQKGVIHRDLKPANILIEEDGGRPVPKVIDFGLAKACGGGTLTDQPLETGAGAVLGTPLYMAPEQAEGDVDTRADVYALGAILYELLTGTTPLDRERFADAGLAEALRLLREEEPPRPSARVARPTARADELDWIVMKALAKERDRRYGSPAALADDLGRFLRHEPVAAGPPSAAYRVRKFLRRHRVPAAAAAAVLLALIGGIIGTAWGLVRAEAARREEATQRVRAEEERDRATRAEGRATASAEKARAAAAEAAAVLLFFETNILKAPRPLGQGVNALGPDVTVRAAIEAAIPKIGVQLRDQPLVEASIRSVVGGTYMWLKRWDLATPLHDEAVRLRRRHLGDADPKTLQSVSQLVRCYAREGRTDRAAALADSVVAGGQLDRLAPRAAARPYANLAEIYLSVGRADRAIAILEPIHRTWAASAGPTAAPVVLAKTRLAAAHLAADRPADAWPLIRAVIGQTGRTAADQRLAAEVLADTAVRVGKAAEAEAGLRACLEELGQKRAPRSLEMLGLRVRLGDNLLAQGRVAEAAEELKAAHRALEARLPDAWMTAEAKSLFGAALAAERASPRAERLMTEGHDGLVARSAEDPAAVPRWRVERSYERVRGYYEANGARKKLREWEGKRAQPAS
ncbi:MAG: protein kinase domain-containing protein, partial [Gemmataceae bacterium]